MFLDEKKVFKLYILSHFIFLNFILFLRWRPVHTKDDNYNDNDTEAQNCWNHFQNYYFFQLMNDKNTDSQSESTWLQRPWAFKVVETKQQHTYNKKNDILHWCGH